MRDVLAKGPTRHRWKERSGDPKLYPGYSVQQPCDRATAHRKVNMYIDTNSHFKICNGAHNNAYLLTHVTYIQVNFIIYKPLMKFDRQFS